ncbi:hypothetical protein [Streptomyces parvulus]|uniref:hypothetical protein n=1 Tax=Streptomyces parvulus TaxID=146923 RepID=UPI0015EFEEFF|nr:hypothetical protein [Streptomyces parvulus]
MLRLTMAAAPLMRSPHEGIAESVDDLLAAAQRIEDNERLDRALDRFGREVAAVLGP